MYENRNGTDIYYYYDSYGVPTAIRYYLSDGTSYRFILATNSLGDVTGVYNMAGELVIKYEYDAWGNIISETDANGNALIGRAAEWNEINPFRYRGYYYDKETGLYYLQSRYYDAEVGRFINQDCYISTGTGLFGYNMFAYCDNSPIILVDDGGNRPIVGASLSKETAVERSQSCTAMNPKRTKAPELPKRKFSSYLKEAVKIEGGYGFGYGASTEVGYLSFSGEVCSNIHEFEISNGKLTNYAFSLKMECSASSYVVEHGVRYGARFDLTNSDLDEDDSGYYCELKDKWVLGGSFYKEVGGYFYITIDWSEFDGLFEK